MFVVLLGAPGSGKGTQAEFLRRHLDLPHAASGDLFRENIFQKTKLGREIEGYILRGALIPDSLTIAVLQERLCHEDARKGAILDGFPRTLEQASALDDLLKTLQKRIDVVLYIKVPDEILVERLSQRLICRECHAPFHKVYKPFQLCSYHKCHGEHLYQRVDDRPETVKVRLLTFHECTAPLIDYYSQRGLLKTVQGLGAVDEVGKAIIEAIPKARNTRV